MEQKVYLKYINTQLEIGMADVRNVYLLSPAFQKLLPEVYKGKLVYRIKNSSKRISLEKIKIGLVKKYFSVSESLHF